MIEKRKGFVGVLGLGYVGLPLLLHLYSNGVDVLGFDIDESLVIDLNQAESKNPYVNNELLRNLVNDSKSEISTDETKLRECDVIVVCVPTPLTESHEVDLKYLRHAVDIIDANISSSTLVINESTSYPGTLREIFAAKLLSQDFRNIFLATAPERIDPGNATPIYEIPRVVSGIDAKSSSLAEEFYTKFFKTVVMVKTPEIAEMSKLLENTFRQVNISLVNEINDLCRRAGIDTREVIEAANSKPYGFMKFSPSAGIGGHCIPVDPEYLQYFAAKFGGPLKMISAATSVNREMGRLIFNRLSSFSESSRFAKGLILGVAYKPNVPDSRDTPAQALIDYLRSQGLTVNWHDPIVKIWNGEYSTSIDSNTWDFGIVVTAHDDLDIAKIKRKCGLIFDCTGRYLSDPEIVQI